MFKKISLIVAFGFLSTVHSSSSLLDDIGQSIKGIIAQDDRDMRELLMGHYEQFQFVEQGRWLRQAFDDIKEQLAPADFTKENLYDFMDSSVAAALKNQYLCGALESIHENNADIDVLRFVDEQGQEILPLVATYAYALNQLTKAIYDDINILVVCNQIWDVALGWNKYLLPLYMSPFGAVKYYTLNGGRKVIDMYEEEEIHPDQFRWYLPLNIWEAAITDRLYGNMDNYQVGRILAAHKPGGVLNEATGAGPAVMQSNKTGTQQVFGLFCDLPKTWADLYGVWNLAFVAGKYPNWPFFFAKLLIPQVLDIEERPEEYMVNRYYALILHANFETMGRMFGGLTSDSMNWQSQLFARSLGAVNIASAHDYEDKVRTVQE